MSEDDRPEYAFTDGTYSSCVPGTVLSFDCDVNFKGDVTLEKVNKFQANYVVDIVKASGVSDAQDLKIELGTLGVPVDSSEVTRLANEQLADSSSVVRVNVLGLSYQVAREGEVWQRVAFLHVLTRPFGLPELVNGS